MNLLAQLQSEFLALNTSSSARRTVARLAASHQLLEGLRDPSDVVAALRQGGEQPSLVLNALIAASPTERFASRIILQAFLPSIKSAFSRVHLNDHNRDDFTAELIAAVYEGIESLAALPPQTYPATMINRTIDTATKRWQRHIRRLPEPMGEIDDQVPGTIVFDNTLTDDRTAVTSEVLAAIVQAVHTGNLDPADGNFLARALLNGDDTQSEADRLFYARRTIQMRLRRTVEVLADQLAPAA